ncbi:uncharacterized protein C56G2.4-like [Haliotis rufescens]|uniref:uncharacterized protein C56G2.4-like n=1 Tax=Haliotis rufescens TaxID=6454 RepID=UPI00201F010A|nr:uncharacterized protein C56G2.4-like [Haliotis rufescens]
MDFRQLCIAFLLLKGAATSYVKDKSDNTVCSESRRTWDLSSCLGAIRRRAENNKLFWFGSEYVSKCGDKSEFSADCYNPKPYSEDSVVSRIFQRGDYDKKNLDRFMEITFIAQPGKYEACGNVYSSQHSQLIAVDPLSDQVHTPYQLKDMPYFWWESEEKDMFSLVIYDPGYLNIKGFYINIRGSNVTTGEAIQVYEGPQNPTKNVNPYVFLVFKQKDYIKMPVIWRQKFFYRSSPMDFTELKQQFSLTGPVAMSWVRVVGDPYAADIMKKKGYMNTCPQFIADAFKTKETPFIPRDKKYRPDLNVYVNVTFQSPAVNFNSCCSFFTLPQKTITLNPIGNAKVKAAYARQEVIPKVELSMATAFPSATRDFRDKLLTLIVVDPDVPLPEFGNKEIPFVHWLVVNICDGQVDNGEVVQSYIGPAPPDKKPHNYYFLVFEQSYELEPSEVSSYAAANCSQMFRGRCRYSLNSLVKTHGLKLVGATWMLSENDEFVRHIYIGMGQPRCRVCKDVPGYGIPCPSSEQWTSWKSKWLRRNRK